MPAVNDYFMFGFELNEKLNFEHHIFFFLDAATDARATAKHVHVAHVFKRKQLKCCKFEKAFCENVPYAIL